MHVDAHVDARGDAQADAAPGSWFRLVRSRTPPPEPVDEIATVRPLDDPRVARFSYRLRRLHETIVEKTHVPYRLSAEKLAHLRHMFIDADWGAASTEFPSYAPDVAANPFRAFSAIPARARYQFLLDDALYHVKSFIHGPVCKGQVALDVIDEHFLIFFLAPDADPSVTDSSYLQASTSDLAIPAEGGDGVEAIFERFKLHELAYLRAQRERLRAAPGRTLRDVWNGDGVNRQAVLPVYPACFEQRLRPRGRRRLGSRKTACGSSTIRSSSACTTISSPASTAACWPSCIRASSTAVHELLLRIESENQLLPAFSRPRGERPSEPPGTGGAGVSALVDTIEPLCA